MDRCGCKEVREGNVFCTEETYLELTGDGTECYVRGCPYVILNGIMEGEGENKEQYKP